MRTRNVSILALVPTLACPAVARGEDVAFEVRETAGIRRFGYPVGAVLELSEPAAPSARFRVLQDGRPVDAQLRPLSRKDDLIASVAVDFEGNFLPRESRSYTLEVRPGLGASPEPSGGLKVEPGDATFRVASGAHLEYVVPRDLGALLQSVKTPALEWIRRGGKGLSARAKDGAVYAFSGAAGAAARVAKEGPIDCVLAVEHASCGDHLPGATAKVEVEFPRSKSWARVDCIVDDPRGVVAGLEAELDLSLGDGPTLVDFGAGSLVYAALAKDQAAALEASRGGRTWKVTRGPPGRLEPYVLAPADGTGIAAEGWAHVMDSKRCTAVAVEGFARDATDRIEAQATGRLVLSRDFRAAGADPPPGPKRLRFWLHFVDFPAHVGAVTSPQSMLAPLEVTRQKKGV